MGELKPHDGESQTNLAGSNPNHGEPNHVNRSSVTQTQASATMAPSTCDDPLPTDAPNRDAGGSSAGSPASAAAGAWGGSSADVSNGATVGTSADVSASAHDDSLADTSISLDSIATQVREALDDLQSQAQLGPGQMLVVGASSSEVVGKRIGTATSLAVGKVIAAEAINFAGTVGCEVAFQCCEHLNRSLVVKKTIARERGWQEVAARPVPGAGGAVAASAYQLLPDACLVETITAEAGIDIGDTFIGMHLRRVAVPVRGRRREIGQAHLTMARTRPPLIGGARAVYDEQVYRERMGLTD